MEREGGKVNIFAANVGREIREVRVEPLPRPKREEPAPLERRERQVPRRRRKREKAPV